MKKCLMPYTSVTVTTTGDIKPCCAYNGSLGEYTQPNDLVDYFSGNNLRNLKNEFDNNIIPQGCMNCYKKDSLGLPSKMKKYSNRLSRSGYNENDLYDSTTPLFVELAISNNCNLDCVMCSSEFSSSLKQLDTDFSTIHAFRNKPYKSFSLSKQFVSGLIDVTKNASLGVELIGGEPLYHKTTLEYLKQVIENDIDIPICITTNITILNDEIISLLSQIKQLTLNLSIDGIDDIFYYVRGIEFDVVDVNYKKLLELDNIQSIIISPCLSIYNIFNIVDFIKYFGISTNYRFDNLVIDPTYLNISLIPLEFREMLLADINDSIDINEMKDISKKQFIELLELLQTATNDNDDILDNSKKWTNEMNNRRGINIWDLEDSLLFLKN